MPYRARLLARTLMLCALLTVSTGISLAAATHAPRTFPKRAGGPELTFASDRARATGATPGTTVYFANVSLVSADYTLRVEKSSGWAKADGTGTAEFMTDVVRRSVWIVVDEDGYTVAAPHGMLIEEMDFPGAGIQDNAHGDLRRVLLDRFSIDAYLIRPGTGIWTGYLRDGGPLDEDGKPDGATAGDLNDLQPVNGTTGSPERFSPGDFLFVVDRNSLEFHVARRGRQ